MNSERKLSAALGTAFLFQATTSLISGMIPMSLIVPGNIGQSMLNIAGHAGLMSANFLGDLIASVGVIALGVLLSSFCGSMARYSPSSPWGASCLKLRWARSTKFRAAASAGDEWDAFR